MNTLKLAADFTMPAIDYAGQGNAILGIRDAGKTYTAMKIAEELMDNNIPMIVYDPVGVWKNLKIGTGKHKGYPIVTAGGDESDIRLTMHNAADIVRAAMKENVSLVIDLYSPELINKSTWIKIVQETVDLLMYENKTHGMRHIFIEEAAEFIPQRLQPQHSRVYASIERLARMGRNARLGYTIINQRAEEVNKAILEISSLSLLHKQVGKNSLLSVQKWLDLLQLENTKEIIKSLPGLLQGQCWAIGATKNPQLIQISSRKTFHPDPKKSTEKIDAAKKKVDVTAWVEKLNKLLVKPVKDNKSADSVKATEDVQSKNIITQLQNELREKDKKILQWKKIAVERGVLLTTIKNKIVDYHNSDYEMAVSGTNGAKIESILPKSETKPAKSEIPQRYITNGSTTVTGGAMRMLKAAAMFSPKPITKTRMAALARLSYTSGSFSTYLSTLKREGLITGDGNNFTITGNGLQHAGDVEPLPTDPMILIDLWCDVIGNQGGASRMLRILSKRYPNSLTKQELGEWVEMSHTSGSFSTYLSTLKRNGLIKIESGEVKAADELFN